MAGILEEGNGLIEDTEKGTMIRDCGLILAAQKSGALRDCNLRRLKNISSSNGPR